MIGLGYGDGNLHGCLCWLCEGLHVGRFVGVHAWQWSLNGRLKAATSLVMKTALH